MFRLSSGTEFLADVIRGRRFDLVEISTIALGVVLVTALAMMF